MDSLPLDVHRHRGQRPILSEHRHPETKKMGLQDLVSSTRCGGPPGAEQRKKTWLKGLELVVANGSVILY